MEVIQTAIYNKIMRKYEEIGMDNFVDFLIYIMEMVEEFSYALDSEKKNEITKSIARKINPFECNNIDPVIIDAIIENICRASKNNLKVNTTPSKKWYVKIFCM